MRPSEDSVLSMIAAIENSIRWHYYIEACGRASADPSLVGIDRDILADLEKCLDADHLARLKQEAEQWYDTRVTCLNVSGCFDDYDWQRARDLIHAKNPHIASSLTEANQQR